MSKENCEAWTIVDMLRQYMEGMANIGVIYHTRNNRHMAIRYELLGFDWYIVGVRQGSNIYCHVCIVNGREARSDDDRLLVGIRAKAEKSPGFWVLSNQTFDFARNQNPFKAWQDTLPKGANYLLEYMRYVQSLVNGACTDEKLLRSQLAELQANDSKPAPAVPGWPKKGMVLLEE